MTLTNRFMMRGMFSILLALSVTATDAWAIPPTTGLPTINYWRDACEVGTHFDDPTEMQRVIDATGFIVDPTLVHDNLDGTYRIDSAFFTAFDGMTFSPDSHFYGEPMIYFTEGHPGRTAFLVGPDSVVTTPHTASWDLTDYYVVFGYESIPDGFGGCLPADLSHVPASRMRRIDTYINGFSSYYGDYLVAYLDEEVNDRPFLRVRRDGHAEREDEATVVGHPGRLAKKIDTAGRVVAMSGDVPLVQPLHTIRFNSGSPLYNLSRQYVELAVAFAGSCATYVCSGPGGPSDCSTHALASQCPASPGWLNSSIKTFATLIEPIALDVAPLSTYRIGTAAAGFTEPLTTYTLSAPGGEHSSESIEYLIEAPSDDDDGPYLEIVSPVALSGSLKAGKSLSFDVAAVMPPGQACGLFPREFVVHDLTHDFTDRVRQTLEVGYTAFSTPTGPLQLEGIEQPYTATRTLTIQNLRSTTASVRVVGGASWLKIDGNIGSPSLLPQTVVTVPGGSNVNVTVGLGPGAVALPLFDEYRTSITLESSNGVCNLTAPISVPLTFRPGVLTVEEKIDATVPPATAIGLGQVLTSTLTVGEQFCISEVRASYLFDHAPGSYAVADWLTEAGWLLQRPDSKRSTPLWDGDTVPVCNAIRPNPPSAVCYLYDAYYADCLKDGSEASPACQVLTVGDTQRPVPTTCAPGDGDCENFASLNGKPAQGIWTTTLADRLVGGVSPQPTLRGWSLTFRGSATCSN